LGAPSHRCEAGQERLAPLVRLEVARNGKHGAPVEIEVSLRVASRGEELNAAPLRAPHLDRVERNLAPRHQREHRFRLVLFALHQALLEILEQGALRSATAGSG
jgi:hypothetical protein